MKATKKISKRILILSLTSIMFSQGLLMSGYSAFADTNSPSSQNQSKSELKDNKDSSNQATASHNDSDNNGKQSTKVEPNSNQNIEVHDFSSYLKSLGIDKPGNINLTKEQLEYAYNHPDKVYNLATKYKSVKDSSGKTLSNLENMVNYAGLMILSPRDTVHMTPTVYQFVIGSNDNFLNTNGKDKSFDQSAYKIKAVVINGHILKNFKGGFGQKLRDNKDPFSDITLSSFDSSDWGGYKNSLQIITQSYDTGNGVFSSAIKSPKDVSIEIIMEDGTTYNFGSDQKITASDIDKIDYSKLKDNIPNYKKMQILDSIYKESDTPDSNNTTVVSSKNSIEENYNNKVDAANKNMDDLVNKTDDLDSMNALSNTEFARDNMVYMTTHPTPIVKDGQRYQPIPLIMGTSSGSISMGASALYPEGGIITDKNGDRYLQLTFHPMFYMMLKGHLIKLEVGDSVEKGSDLKVNNLKVVDPITTYEENGFTYPQTYNIKLQPNQIILPVKVHVDMMGDMEPFTYININTDRPYTPNPNDPSFIFYHKDGKIQEQTQFMKIPGNPDAKVIDKLGNVSDIPKKEETKASTTKKAPQASSNASTPTYTPSTSQNSKNSNVSQSSQVRKYEVETKLMNAYTDGESMGNKAMEQESVLTLNPDNSGYIDIIFKPLDFMGMHGHVLKVWSYPTLDNAKSETNKTLMTPIESYLDRGVKYPKTYRFNFNNIDDLSTLPIRVEVDAMDSIANPSNDPNLDATKAAYINIDKNSIVKISEKQADTMSKKDVTSNSNSSTSSSTTSNATLSNATNTTKDNATKENVATEINKELVPKVQVKNGERIYAKNRVETSVNISKKYFKKTDTVVIASGTNFADALSASSFASMNHSPILLVNNSLDSSVKNEIKRLGAKNIVIVGGDKAVSENVASSIKNLGVSVDRVNGKNRMETSLLLSNRVEKKTKSDKAIIVNAYNNSDALSLASLADKENLPIIMVNKDGQVINGNSKENLKDVLDNLGVKNAYVVGGEQSITKNAVNGLGDINIKRISGKNRFETALKISKMAYPNSKDVILVNGNNPVDALGAGPITNILKAPILFVQKDSMPSDISNAIKGKKEHVIGGVQTISDKEVEKLNKL